MTAGSVSWSGGIVALETACVGKLQLLWSRGAQIASPILKNCRNDSPTQACATPTNIQKKFGSPERGEFETAHCKVLS